MDENAVIRKLISMGWSEGSAKLGIRAGFRCEYCGRDLLADVESYKSWQNDHIIPLSRGGKNEFENMAVACRTCNFNLKGRWDRRKDLNPRLSRDENVRQARASIEQKRSEVLAEIEEIRKLIQWKPRKKD